MSQYDRERLERVGFVLHTTAEGLREVRERWPAQDQLALRLYALEQEARGITGEVLMELREAEGTLP